MFLAAMGLVAALGLWAGLKIGRPVYYSDGGAEVSATELRNSGMVRWSTPQPEFEIPGPVRGRVCELPDGRLIYGRAMSAQVRVTKRLELVRRVMECSSLLRDEVSVSTRRVTRSSRSPR